MLRQMPVTLEPCGVVTRSGVLVTSDACHVRAVCSSRALVMWWLRLIPVTLEPCGVVPCFGGVVVTSDVCDVRDVWSRPTLW